MYDRLAETEERIVMLPVLQEITINPDGLAVTEQGQHPKVCTRFVLFWGHKQAQADTDTHRHRHRQRQRHRHRHTHAHTDTETQRHRYSHRHRHRHRHTHTHTHII